MTKSKIKTYTLTRKDFETKEDYLSYPMDSFINGNGKQAIQYYKLLVSRGYRQEMLSFLKSHYSENFINEFLNHVGGMKA